jgi:hypothetical protein
VPALAEALDPLARLSEAMTKLPWRAVAHIARI